MKTIDNTAVKTPGRTPHDNTKPPRLRTRSVLKGNRWLVDTYICHRGYHSRESVCPENSMKAFERALRRGFAIEFDIHHLADGEIAVFHDRNTYRMTGIDRLLENCDADQIGNMRLLGTDQSIPLLDHVLDLVRGDVPLLIELKNMGKAGPLEYALLQKLKGYCGTYAIQSFNPKTLLWFRYHAPLIPRGQISGSLENMGISGCRKFFIKNLLTNPFTRPHFVSYEAACLPNWKTSKLLKRGVPILGWTVASLSQYRQIKRYCDNIIFEGFDPYMALI
jgi:glycerophosphoryl diester phosphodiesterase